MLTKYPYQSHGHVNHGWLDSHFHFSFAEYYNPHRMNFGVLRVINDDFIQPRNGFDLHPHRDMEILSYVVDGALTHGDSMNHNETIFAGEAQYMSAGSGIYHSEYNYSEDITRILQIWVLPDKKNVLPQYGDVRMPRDIRVNKWFHLVSPLQNEAPIVMHQDVNMYVTLLDEGMCLSLDIHTNRQAYVIQIEGDSIVNNTVDLQFGDGLEAIGTNITFQAKTKSHIFVIEMAKQ